MPRGRGRQQGTLHAPADTALGSRVAAVADANLGKSACSANSTGQGGVGKLGYNDVQYVDLVYSAASRTEITTIGGNEDSQVSEMTFAPADSVINGGAGQKWGQSVIGHICSANACALLPGG